MTATLIFANKITCLTVELWIQLWQVYVHENTDVLSPFCENLQQEIISFNETATKIQSYH